jgi:hypothetical protein
MKKINFPKNIKEIDEKWLTEALSKEKKFGKVKKIINKNVEITGFLGEVNKVTIETEESSFDLVIKFANEKMREILKVSKSYEREVTFYKNYNSIYNIGPECFLNFKNRLFFRL